MQWTPASTPVKPAAAAPSPSASPPDEPGCAAAQPGPTLVDVRDRHLQADLLRAADSLADPAAAVAAAAQGSEQRQQRQTAKHGLKTLSTLILGTEDVAVLLLRGLSVLQLWRARRVCKLMLDRCAAVLRMMQRPLAVGGVDTGNGQARRWQILPTVEELDLSTMAWQASARLPALPEPRDMPAVCVLADGCLAVLGGQMAAASTGQGCETDVLGFPMWTNTRTGMLWSPTKPEWTPLPPMSVERCGAAAVGMADGQLLVAGGMPCQGVALPSHPPKCTYHPCDIAGQKIRQLTNNHPFGCSGMSAFELLEGGTFLASAEVLSTDRSHSPSHPPTLSLTTPRSIRCSVF